MGAALENRPRLRVAFDAIRDMTDERLVVFNL